MKEEELAEKFISFFNDGYEVYPEVPAGGGVIDFVATDGTIQIGCEVKNSFNLKVMEQAWRKQRSFNYTYICVPQKRDYHFREIMAKKLGIGVLTYTNIGDGKVMELRHPKLNRNANCPDLKEYMKLSSAGTQSDRVTAFGWTVKQMERYLKRRGPTHIEEVLKNIDYHYGTVSTAKSSIRKWIQSGVIDSIEWEKAIVSLKVMAEDN